MASELYTEDPRTGCWTPAEGVTAEDVYERFRGPLPADVVPEVICGRECVNPGHVRPVRHIGRVVVEPPKVAPEPTPAAPAKRGPGRPRKTR